MILSSRFVIFSFASFITFSIPLGYNSATCDSVPSSTYFFPPPTIFILLCDAIIDAISAYMF